MKIALPAIAVITCLLLFTCRKKEKPVTYTGRLLFTRKNPYPIANRNIRMDQYGSGGALGGSTFAGAGTQTDASGFFQIVFTPGTSTFLLINSTNSSPLTLSGTYSNDSTLRFSRDNFPDPAYDASKPMYIGKTIDTAIISVQLASDLLATDTIGLEAVTTTGPVNKEYTRRTGTVGSTIVLDTIYNILFTEFDCQQRAFTNTLHAGRKYKYPYGTFSISTEGPPLPVQLSEADEGKQNIRFSFKKY